VPPWTPPSASADPAQHLPDDLFKKKRRTRRRGEERRGEGHCCIIHSPQYQTPKAIAFFVLGEKDKKCFREMGISYCFLLFLG
jgi:hypothetical protein